MDKFLRFFRPNQIYNRLTVIQLFIIDIVYFYQVKQTEEQEIIFTTKEKKMEIKLSVQNGEKK
jgi:ascorbate-specific PTS system EIIC-type component UlaA